MARVVDADDERAAVVSTLPMTTATKAGGKAPVDLGLKESGDGLVPRNPLVPVRFPSRLRDGVELLGEGLAITPLDAAGRPLDGAPLEVGDTAAVYANTERDADTLVKPLPVGLETNTILRSPASPERLFFGIEGDGALRLAQTDGGAVDVKRSGETVAVVPMPAARDAAGDPVEVSMRASGRTLMLSIPHRDRDYLYPLDVDPSVVATQSFASGPGNWLYQTDNGGSFHHGSDPTNGLVAWGSGAPYSAGNYGLWGYATQGASRITRFQATSFAPWYAEDQVYNTMGIIGPGGWEASQYLGYTYGATGTDLTAGGSDGNVAVYQQNAAATGTAFSSRMPAATLTISQDKAPTASFNHSDPTVGGHPNALAGTGWVSPGDEAHLGLEATDPGMGIYRRQLHDAFQESYPQWNGEIPHGPVPGCVDVQCDREYSAAVPIGNLADGLHRLVWHVENAVGPSLSHSTSTRLGVDGEAPGISLTGIPEDGVIGMGKYDLRVAVADGEPGEGYAGVANSTSGIPDGFVVELDGEAVLVNEDECGGSLYYSPPCQVTDRYEVSGKELGFGVHIVKVTAEDRAGNVRVEEVPLTVKNGPSVEMGPGSLDIMSGGFSLSSTDVAESTAGAGLAVMRSHNSFDTEIEDSPFGPNWRLSLGGWHGVTRLPDGNAAFTDARGRIALFKVQGEGEFEPPKGYSGYVLSYSAESPATYTLKDASGNVTTFKRPDESGDLYLPASFDGPGGSEATTFQFETVEGVSRPAMVMGPTPSGVTCAPELVRGCRALSFEYAASTTASGEDPGDWGDYDGRLTGVDLHAWDPDAEEMESVRVVSYAYDSRGRLRAGWDPRVSPAVKTTYGYDPVGRVTALTPPGRQPWLMRYSAVAGSGTSKRLVAVSRPKLSVEVSDGTAPTSESAPPLSSLNPVVGEQLESSAGEWDGEILDYTYQWVACEGVPDSGDCDPVPGATGSAYTPGPGIEGRRLAVEVSATNAGGTTVARSRETPPVVAAGVDPYPAYAFDLGTPGSGQGELDTPQGVAVDSADAVWVADQGNDRVQKFSLDGEGNPQSVSSFGSSGSGEGQFSEPTGIAVDHADNVYVADTGNDRIVKLSNSGEFLLSFGSTGEGSGQFDGPTHLAIDNHETRYMWVVDAGNNRLQYFNEENQPGGEVSTFTRFGFAPTELQKPLGIGVTWEGHGIVADGFIMTNALEFSFEGELVREIGKNVGVPGDGAGEFGEPDGIAVTPPEEGSGDYYLYVVDAGVVSEFEEYFTPRRRVEVFDQSGGYVTQLGSKGTDADEFDEPSAIALRPASSHGPSGHAMYVSEPSNDRIQAWRTDVGEQLGSSPQTESVTWTATYHVPVSGEGAPHQLGAAQVGEWAQEDVPTDATAIFPPDQVPADPNSPASFQRAAVYYMDPAKRIVNTRGPGGRINVEEYDADDNVVRTLSPSSRQRVLDLEGSKAEREALARQIDTQHSYSQDGTELEEVLGPLHDVELESGSTVEARLRTAYTYDENPPAGGPYHLVTRQTEGAWIPATEEEEDVRTKLFYYDGQDKLGWELRSPTTTITDPAGLHLVEKSFYDPSSGQVVKTTKPADPDNELGTAEETIHYTAGESDVEECGDRPEWEGLPCQTRAAAPDAQGTPPGRQLEAVSCATAESCVAVGRHDDEGEAEGQEMPPVLLWDGTEWSEQSVPSPGETEGEIELNDVSCGTDATCAAVGAYEDGSKWTPFVAKRNGAEWTVKAVPVFEGQPGRLEGVSCKWLGEYSTEWCVAAGFYVDGEGKEIPLVAEGNNTTGEWGTQPLSSPYGTESTRLTDVSCPPEGWIFAPCLAVGHFDDASRDRAIAYERDATLVWQKSELETQHSWEWDETRLNSVACEEAESALRCSAAGYKTDESASVSPLTLRWAGEGWAEDPDPTIGEDEAPLRGIACVAVEECDVVGGWSASLSAPVAGGWEPEAEEWQLAEDLHPEGADQAVLESISCPEAGLCMAVGHFTTAEDAHLPFTAEWDGSEWSIQWTPEEEEAAGPAVEGLPVTTTTYDLYNQPAVSTEVAGEAVRTATVEYDEAGRATSTAIAATEGESLPTINVGYDEETGMPRVQSTETESIVSSFDGFGRLTSYLDADGNTTTYEYAEGGGELIEVDDGKGTRSFEYDELTGDLTKVEDSSVGAFTAEYGADGEIVSESLPNGMKVTYGRDAVGSTISVEYVKASHCEEDCTWFAEDVTQSIHGQILSQQSTFGSKEYEYDGARRLIQVEDKPAGEGCTTTLYEYDENTNRTDTTVRAPAEGGSCATTGGVTDSNAFDAADRLIGEGVSYSSFGATTSLPADDAGGSPLSATYYADDTVATLSQGGRTLEYALDPEGRVRETAESGGGEGVEISHFAGPGDSPAWTEDGSGGWTRYVGGVGGLAAIQSSTEGIEIQIANLHGDLVATAPLDPEAEGLTTSEEASAYGVPGSEDPAKYSWLGGAQRPTELPSGVVNMGARTYIPQLGRFLQTDPVPGGSANAYSYVHGDPVNETDLSGEYTPSLPTWLAQYASRPPYIPQPQPTPADDVEMIDEGLSEGDGSPMAGAALTIPIPTFLTGGCIVCKVAKRFGWFASEAVKAVKSLFKLRRNLRGFSKAVRRRVVRSTKRGIIDWAKEVSDPKHREINLGCVKGALDHFAQIWPTSTPPKVKLGFIATGCIVGYLPE